MDFGSRFLPVRLFWFCLLLVLGPTPVPLAGQANQWTWMGGSQQKDHYPAYGTRGIAAPTNSPGVRNQAVVWVDQKGIT